MPGIRYEQISNGLDERDCEEEISTKPSNEKCNSKCFSATLISLSMISLYFALSIGLTFYQRWLLKDFHFPLSVVIFHLVFKYCMSALIRMMLYFYTGTSRVVLPFVLSLRSVAPTGLASGIDVGFSNWALELVTVSLYTMTKSTTIIFILGFAILMGLERKSSSLVLIVVMISAGLVMFTYKATQFNALGFILLLLASLSSGLRWTFAQLVMQKSKLGLSHPLDFVYYVQPWMLLSVLPFAIGFEGLQLLTNLISSSKDDNLACLLKVSFGAFLAFTMELSEYLVVTNTSSLTLSIAGIFKEMVILVLAVELTGDQLSGINIIGLVVCLLGIIGHIIHKFLISNNKQQQTTIINFPSRLAQNFTLIDKNDKNNCYDNQEIVLFRRNTYNKHQGEHSEPLIADSGQSNRSESFDGHSESDVDSNRVLSDILQRRDTVR